MLHGILSFCSSAFPLFEYSTITAGDQICSFNITEATISNSTSPANLSTATPAKSHIILENFETRPFCILCFLTSVTYRFPLQPFIYIYIYHLFRFFSFKLTPPFGQAMCCSQKSRIVALSSSQDPLRPKLFIFMDTSYFFP